MKSASLDANIRAIDVFWYLQDVTGLAFGSIMEMLDVHRWT